MFGKELINEFADLINRSFEHCNKTRKLKSQTDKAICSECVFNWSYSLGNHGCFLVEMQDQGMIDMLRDAMRYNRMNTHKIDNLEFEDEE